MPRLDGTGPQGEGPRTGRGLGNCGPGYGPNYGCCGRRFFTQNEERDMLVESIQNLKADLKAAEERLAEIKAQ